MTACWIPISLIVWGVFFLGGGIVNRIKKNDIEAFIVNHAIGGMHLTS